MHRIIGHTWCFGETEMVRLVNEGETNQDTNWESCCEIPVQVSAQNSGCYKGKSCWILLAVPRGIGDNSLESGIDQIIKWV